MSKYCSWKPHNPGHIKIHLQRQSPGNVARHWFTDRAIGDAAHSWLHPQLFDQWSANWNLLINITLVKTPQPRSHKSPFTRAITWKRSKALIRWSGNWWCSSLLISSKVCLATFTDETIRIEEAAATTSLSDSLKPKQNYVKKRSQGWF